MIAQGSAEELRSTIGDTLTQCDPLPVAHPARNNAKQRMRSWLRSGNPIAVPRRRSTPEFATKMLPLVEELPFGLGDRSYRSSGCDDARRVEHVTAGLGLVGDDTKVAGDTRQRVGGGAKPLQLRMSRVAASPTEKHRLGKKGFAPQSNEAGGIEMARMDSPEAHETV